jgi:hypothetical protein
MLEAEIKIYNIRDDINHKFHTCVKSKEVVWEIAGKPSSIHALGTRWMHIPAHSTHWIGGWIEPTAIVGSCGERKEPLARTGGSAASRQRLTVHSLLKILIT